MEIDLSKSILQPINERLWIKRDDLIDPIIGGNKFRKLHYNVIEAQRLQKKQLLTFGGAYSNHILATAAAGARVQIDTIGYIRGHAENKLSPALAKAQELGMKLHFMDREAYKNKGHPDFLQRLQDKHLESFIIPEGGTNEHALKGVAQIRNELPSDINVIATACGSGGTLAGLISAYADHEDIILLGFSVLKGKDQLTDTIKQLLKQSGTKPKCKWRIITGYHFGGYAKTPPELINFIQSFQSEHSIPLDFVYTGKMIYGFQQWLNDNKDINKAVALHTGGIFTAPVQ